MSNLALFTDNASSLLASGITNAATTLSLTPGTGAAFPTPGAGQIAVITAEDTLGNFEIMWCTGRSTDTLTVSRGREGTTALAFPSGSRIELRITAGTVESSGGLNNFLQKNGGDTLTGVTNLNGTILQGGSGSIQGGEYAGGFVRSAAGITAGQVYVSGGQPYSGSNLILTQGNIGASMPAGYGLAVSQMIVMWYGSSGAIPSGWLLCNGSGGTPNLTDKFIVGAGGTYAATAGASGGAASTVTGSTSPTGSTDSYTLTAADIPAHTHPLYFSHQTASAGGSIPIPTAQNTSGADDRVSGPNTAGGGHSHTISTGLAHTHTVASILPPYVGLFFIMKS